MADERVVSVYADGDVFKVYDHLKDEEKSFESAAAAGQCAKTVIKNWPRPIRRKRKRKNVIRIREMVFADYRVSKQTYTCHGCGSTILVGNSYWRVYGKLGHVGRFSDCCYCQNCGGSILKERDLYE